MRGVFIAIATASPTFAYRKNYRLSGGTEEGQNVWK